MIERRHLDPVGDKIGQIERSLSPWRKLDQQLSSGRAAAEHFKQVYGSVSAADKLAEQFAAGRAATDHFRQIYGSVSASDKLAEQFAAGRAATDRFRQIYGSVSAANKLAEQFAAGRAATDHFNGLYGSSQSSRELNEQLGSANFGTDKLLVSENVERESTVDPAREEVPKPKSSSAESAMGIVEPTPILSSDAADGNDEIISESATPPKAVERFFWFVLPASERHVILGDAEEAYRQTWKRYGRSAAEFDYAKELLGAAIYRLWTVIERAAKLFRSQG